VLAGSFIIRVIQELSLGSRHKRSEWVRLDQATRCPSVVILDGWIFGGVTPENNILLDMFGNQLYRLDI